MKKRILVIEHVPHEGLGLIGSVLKSFNVEVSFCRPFANEKVPEKGSFLAQYDGLILMGGPMNVDQIDRYPFLKEERVLTAAAVDSDKAVLGVCLGAQMIARALGARVYPGAHKEIGWYPITLSERGKKDAVFGFEGRASYTVFQWHGDTFDLPRGADLLASSEAFPNQAFRYGSKVCAMQFHCEMTAEMVFEWVEKNRDELHSVRQYIDREGILAGVQTYEHELASNGTRILTRYFQTAGFVKKKEVEYAG